MSTTDLEKENLEAHVDLCAQRYDVLEYRLSKVEESVAMVHKMLRSQNEQIARNNKTLIATIVSTAGTIIVGLLGTLGVLLMNGS
jgi:hypothetical protein